MMLRRQFLSTGAASLAAISLGALRDPAAASTALRSTALALPLAPARMADLLCQSYLINTKIFYKDQVYGHTDAVIDLLRELGGRGIREKMTVGRSIGTKNQRYAMPLLANDGIRWHGTVGEVANWQNAAFANKEVMDDLSSYYAPKMGGDLTKLMHSFGGCNEIDNSRNGADWAQHARIMQTQLWNQAKANPDTRNVPVAGPSTRTDFTEARAAKLGDLSAISEMGNGHLYNKGRSPTGEIDEHLRILDPVFPRVDEWIMTETGYNNSPQDNLGKTVPEFASAIYAIRGLCDFFKRNTAYCRFELLDDPDPIDYYSQATINRTAERNAHFGLVAMTKDTVAQATPDTWRKKPEFYATRDLLRLIADRGAAFSPDPLQVQVSGGGSDLQQLLLQKRDGRHYLLLWRDVNVCNLYPQATPIHVPPVQLTVEIAPFRPIAIYVPNRGPGAETTYSARGSFSMPLAGELKVVEIG